MSYKWEKHDHVEPVDKVSFVRGLSGLGLDYRVRHLAGRRRCIVCRESAGKRSHSTGSSPDRGSLRPPLMISGCSVTRPLAAITRSMKLVAEGHTDVEATGTDRRDEMGSLARALAVFLNNAQEMERMRKARETQRQASESERRLASRRTWRSEFENSVGGIVQGVAAATGQLQMMARDHVGLRRTGRRSARPRWQWRRNRLRRTSRRWLPRPSNCRCRSARSASRSLTPTQIADKGGAGNRTDHVAGDRY